ncbi:MAG: SOS response-associated peptidase [Microbacter sp.]
MCFYFKLTQNAQMLEHRFNASLEHGMMETGGFFNGFQHPLTPVITNAAPERIQWLKWGLIPPWAKDETIASATLNARVETIAVKPAFKYVLHQRCLIPADGFYEWQWLDEKGKKKQKYLLTLPDGELFAFAGLWSEWKNPINGQSIKTFSIVTMEANPLMRQIHNSKKRMPVITTRNHENDWLNNQALIIQNDRLKALKIGEG